MYTATSPIEFALNRLKMRIPHEILMMAFFPAEDYKTRDATNLNERMRTEVIDSQVMSDMNNNGGVGVFVDVMSSWIHYVSPVVFVINVPKNKTQNRRINNIYNSSFGVSAVNNAGVGVMDSGSAPLSTANRAFRSARPVPYVSTAQVKVIGENQLEIRDSTFLPTRIRLLARIQYDYNFTDLRQPYWKDFAELVELAIKGYCYTKLIGTMDRAFLQGGVEMGRLSSKVEEWSDVMQTYDDYLRERWGRILILNDPLLSSRNNKMITNP